MMWYRLCAGALWPLLNVCLAVQILSLWRVLVTHRDHYFQDDPPWLQHPPAARSLNHTRCDDIDRYKAKLSHPDFRKSYIRINLRRYKKMLPFSTEPSDRPTVITITSWTELAPSQFQWMEDGFRAFDSCANLQPWMQCYYSNSAAILNDSHAVLFHARHMRRRQGIPFYRPLGQKWVFYENQPPTDTWNKVNHKWPFWNLFNLTATYATNSDILLPRNTVPQCDQDPLTAPDLLKDYSAGKEGRILWMPKDCSTPSQREAYVAELGRYISIETFGPCGKPLCGSKDRVLSTEACTKRLLNSTFKFVLVIESSFCYEYLAETLEKSLSYDIIPIVLGLADYTSMFPPGVVINAGRFDSPENLAHYLHFIDQNDELFNRYIRNKQSLSCSSTAPANELSFPCKLCEHLHRNLHKQEQVPDVSQFWSVRYRCQDPGRFYKGIADSIIPKLKASSVYS